MPYSKDEKSTIWDLIRSCNKVDDIMKFQGNKVRKVKTTENAVIVWAQPDTDQFFFTWGLMKREKLKMSGLLLLHVSVAHKSWRAIDSESRYYVIPDSDIQTDEVKLSTYDGDVKSDKFKLSTYSGDYERIRLNKSKNNREILNKEYSKLEPFFGSPEGFEQ